MLREGTHSVNCAEDCSWRRRPCDQQRQFPQSRGSNPRAPDSVHPLSGEHSCCATDFRRDSQVQILVFWEVVDMPVHVQRQVRRL